MFIKIKNQITQRLMILLLALLLPFLSIYMIIEGLFFPFKVLDSTSEVLKKMEEEEVESKIVD